MRCDHFCSFPGAKYFMSNAMQTGGQKVDLHFFHFPLRGLQSVSFFPLLSSSSFLSQILYINFSHIDQIIVYEKKKAPEGGM